MEIEWHNRADFAQLAEAVGIPTDLILGASMPKGKRGDVATVIYSRGGELDDEVRLAHLRRSSDGVLYVDVDEPSGRHVRDYIPPFLRDALDS